MKRGGGAAETFTGIIDFEILQKGEWRESLTLSDQSLVTLDRCHYSGNNMPENFYINDRSSSRTWS